MTPWPDPNWRQTPVVRGRLATEADLVSRTAVFHQDGGGSVFAGRRLPALATYRDGNSKVVPVLVVQAEGGPNDVVVCGARYADGRELMCMLGDLDFDEDPA